MPTRTTGAARWFTEQMLGGPTREIPSSPTIGVTVGKVVQANPDRVGLVVINGGAADVLIWVDNSVSTTKGIRLTANGGSVTMTVHDDFTLPAQEWDGISSGAGNVLSVLEEVSDVILAPEQKP